jgi:hypothetical protein
MGRQACAVPTGSAGAKTFHPKEDMPLMENRTYRTSIQSDIDYPMNKNRHKFAQFPQKPYLCTAFLSSSCDIPHRVMAN